MAVQVIYDPSQAPHARSLMYLATLGRFLQDRRDEDLQAQQQQASDFAARTNGMSPYAAAKVLPASGPLADRFSYLRNAQATPEDQLQEKLTNEKLRLAGADPSSLSNGEWFNRENLFGRQPTHDAYLARLSQVDQQLAAAGVPETDPRRQQIAVQLKTAPDGNTQLKAETQSDLAAAKLVAAGGGVPDEQSVDYWYKQIKSGMPLDDAKKLLGKEGASTYTAVRRRMEGSGTDVKAALTPGTMKALQDTAPMLAEVDDLLQAFEPFKNINTPGWQFKERAKYALGMGSQYGEVAERISQLEMDKVLLAARLLKGSSRSYAALQQAMVHLPNAWSDSPQKLYQQLVNVRRNIVQILNDARKYGAKDITEYGLPEDFGAPAAAAPKAAPGSVAPSAPADPLGIR